MLKSKILLIFLMLSFFGLYTLCYATEYTITYTETELSDGYNKIDFSVNEMEGGVSGIGSKVASLSPVDGVCISFDVEMTVGSNYSPFQAITRPTGKNGKTTIILPPKGPGLICDTYYSFQYFLNTATAGIGDCSPVGCCQITMECSGITFCIDSGELSCNHINDLLTKSGQGSAVWKSNSECNLCLGLCIPTYVEIAQLEAIPLDRAVIVTWSTGAEIDNLGFNIYRAESEDGEYVKINDTLILAEGSPTQGVVYEFTDNTVKNRRTYFYQLEDVDIYGKSTFHGQVSATPRLIYGLEE